MGNPRKPVTIRVLEGNRGHRALPSAPVAYPSINGVPDDLSAGARAEWLRLAPWLYERGLLTVADLGLFRQLCETAASLAAARQAVQEHGEYYFDRAGVLRQNPAARAALNLSKEYRSLCGLFGLSPADRSRVGDAGAVALSDADPMAAILAGVG